MAIVTSLLDYRRKKQRPSFALPIVEDEPASRPHVSKQAIWRKDFSSFGGVIFGILTIRELLGYHLHYFEEWKHYLLQILDICANTTGKDRAALLGDVVRDFKSFLFEETGPENKEDMALVVLILELMEKSALLRQDAPGLQ